ncbi:methylated-DNA--[protein]-cysteine S-methyltransferase [Gulosibacter molinativorax]|uniref:Methylated-DNA--protein-cysteine methyltransferase n=1 Tax=Gulosibacter molinativorax TaxID=256821 RepID=A0ABT7CAJ3_9MICO|nr:methylated-DNA--[protein]-cysteine S-methyltransferase [Gulosibacter molinativorax]MDJ1372215.1 cysteine methyltransferase [Gulosibacter molinativorax]QUY60912.1 Methylated-DNA--protein-cysteine methyltransferase [Gulosibacter molinativorax]
MTTVRHALVETTLGEVTLVADGDDLTGLYFPEHWHLPDETTFGVRVDAEEDDVLARAKAELDEFFVGDRESFDVSVQTWGNEFSERVWAMLREIPYGQTTTYGALAERLGDRRLAQRVGQAVGRNPVCVFIPCHRVVGADGSLTGYAGGLDRKRFLLELEEPAEASGSRLF